MIFRKSKGSTPSSKNSGSSAQNSEGGDVKRGVEKKPTPDQSANSQNISTKHSSVSANPQTPPPLPQGIIAKDSNALFLEILLLAMKAKETQGLALSDLEWFLIPPVRYNQAVVAEAKPQEGGKSMPVGFVLWAKVSPEVDARLAKETSVLPRLSPQEWQSGSIPWVIAAAGRPEIVRAMLMRLIQEQLQNQGIKLRITNPDGTFTVREVKMRPDAEAGQGVTANPLPTP